MSSEAEPTGAPSNLAIPQAQVAEKTGEATSSGKGVETQTASNEVAVQSSPKGDEKSSNNATPAGQVEVGPAVEQTPVQAAPVELSPLSLPSHCSAVSALGHATVVMCQPEKDGYGSQLLAQLPTLTTSLIAIGISLYTLRKNSARERAMRERSVLDEFWLRAVVAPLSIQPYLDHIHGLRASLPLSDTQSLEAVQQYWGEKAKRASELAAAFQSLDLVDASLQQKVRNHLEQVEDILAQYCGHLCSYLNAETTEAPDRGLALQAIHSETVAAMRCIRDHQVFDDQAASRWNLGRLLNLFKRSPSHSSPTNVEPHPRAKQ